MAKSGLNGFMQTLAKDGKRNGIHATAIAPLAAMRMLATVSKKGSPMDFLKVEYIASLVVYICHESCQESDSIFEVSGGTYQKVQCEWPYIIQPPFLYIVPLLSTRSCCCAMAHSYGSFTF